MVDVPTRVPTQMDPLCAAVELDSPWPVMDEAAMVSGIIDIYTGCILRGRKEGKEERVKGERRGGWRGGREYGRAPCFILAVHVKAMDQSVLCP